MEGLFLALVAIVGFSGLLCVGGLVAWLCGCDMNEPEYYARKNRLK